MKKWKKALLHVLTVLLVMAGVCGYFLFLYPHEQNFVESYYKVQSDKLTSHLRIVQLSDLHLREFGENNCDLVARIRALKPDIIAITGDMNDKKSDDTHVVTDLCAQLVEIAPVYYVPGNHEWPKIVFEGSTLASDLEALGVHFLADKYETVTIGSNTLLIGGIAEAPVSYEKYASGFLEDFAAQPGYKMLLVHYPEYYAEYTGALIGKDIDMALCGHAHGGQVRLPFLGALYTPDQGFLPDLTEGVQTISGTKVIISRGLGDDVGQILPRINNPPELVIIDANWY